MNSEPCVNCGGANNGTGMLCSECYAKMSRPGVKDIQAALQREMVNINRAASAGVLCECRACAVGRYQDCQRRR